MCHPNHKRSRDISPFHRRRLCDPEQHQNKDEILNSLALSSIDPSILRTNPISSSWCSFDQILLVTPRRDPECCDANFFIRRDISCQTLEIFSVGRDVPFERLHWHGTILFRWLVGLAPPYRIALVRQTGLQPNYLALKKSFSRLT